MKQFRLQRRNANRHTQRGMGQLEASMRRDGYSTPMVAAADGEVFDGSARLEKAAEVFGVDVEPLVVHSDGTRPVVLIRDDIPSADDPRAQRLALAANRVAQINLDWDVPLVDELMSSLPNTEDMWTREEVNHLLSPIPPDEFKEFNETAADDVEMIECPQCGHRFPK